MTDEKIFELAAQFDDDSPEFAMSREAVIAFAKSVVDEERKRIKSRVKEAAENSWCVRNEVVEDVEGELKRVPYSLYIGPSLNMLEEFVDKLLEV